MAAANRKKAMVLLAGLAAILLLLVLYPPAVIKQPALTFKMDARVPDDLTVKGDAAEASVSQSAEVSISPKRLPAPTVEIQEQVFQLLNRLVGHTVYLQEQ